MDNSMIVVGALILIVLVAAPIIQRRVQSKSPSKNQIGEAEVYLAYGRKKEAKAILEKYLLSNPGDQKALELLKQAN
jgi:predicted Zn-dependent protease